MPSASSGGGGRDSDPDLDTDTDADPSPAPAAGPATTVEGDRAGPADRDLRGLVRFYLLDHRTWLGKAIDVALLALNLTFVAVFVAGTYPVGERLRADLVRLEGAIAVVFLAEYLLRLYGAESRLAELFDPYTVVDLVAIAPALVVVASPATLAVEAGFLRVVRVVRVLRFYRFTRDAEFFFGTVADNTLRALELLLTVLVLFFLSAGLFYSVEHVANPNVDTFGDAFYYTVVTLSTVGFGDVLPVTRAGRWVTVATILAGVIVVPWQASKIVREWAARDTVDVTCPNCGLAAHDRDASHCKACGHVIYQEYEGNGPP
jgi:voltage-gated potassium channel